MKVALITDGIYPYVLGGMQKHSYYLAKYLAKWNVQVTVFHCLQGQTEQYHSYFTKDELENLQFIEIDFPEKKSLPGHYLRESKAYSRLIAEHITKNKLSFDFIYTKGFTGSEFIDLKIDCPIGVQLHGLEMFQKGGTWKQWLEKRMLRPRTKKLILNMDFVFSYGGKIKDILLKNGVAKEKLILQHGAADEFWLQDLSKDKSLGNTFLFVGRYEYRKGHHLVNEMTKSFQGNFLLKMVGNVPLDLQVKDSRIRYLGNQLAENIKEEMKKCTFLLVPSLAEGFPTIIVEALAQGLIPIATNVGAVKEIVNHENGILIDPNSVQELIKGMKKALSLGAEKRKVLSENARKVVENDFNWDKAAKLLIRDIEKSIDSWKRTYSK